MSQNAMVYGESTYLDFFGLDKNPFPVAPDNQNFFLSRRIDQILTDLLHGITARKGFIVLSGDIGLGKTTISRRIISTLAQQGVETSLVLHTFCQDLELLIEINRDFGLESDSPLFRDQMRLLRNFLLAQSRKGKNCAIIIDDAQNLNHQSLELVRMISNLEADHQKLVQILLIGQPELLNNLSRPVLRQLKSRIIIREEVQPLSPDELQSYVLFKLAVSGNRGLIEIQKSAFEQIHKLTKGNFRQVNKLMDRCLYVACLHHSTLIGDQVVMEAYRDLEPDKRPADEPSRKRIAMLAPIMVPVLVAGIFLLPLISGMSSGPVNSGKPENMIAEEQVIEQPKPVMAETLDFHPPKAASLKLADSIKVPDAVIKFLANYQLSKFEYVFYDAFKSGHLFKVAETILRETGYEIIQLDYLPEFVRGRYGILQYPSGVTGKMSYLLMWRPHIELTDFHHNYDGPEIYALKQMLAKLKFYKGKLDGRVDLNLINALSQFQMQMALPATGYPDKRTLFLISQKAGAK